MKKIAILTYHNALNYGAVFQAYALKEYLNRQEEVEAKILNYGGEVAKTASKFFLFKYCIKHPSYILNLATRIKMMRKFREFRRVYLGVTKTRNNKIDVDFETFIVGSDQVWNPNINSMDKTYLLDFTNKEKYAYAASLGDFRDKRILNEYFKDNLEKFTAISLRENSSIDVIKEYYSGELITCLDPVFLLGMNEWINLYKKDIKENVNKYISEVTSGGYVLYFSLDLETEKLKAVAVDFAKQKNLKIIFVTDNERRERYKDLLHFGVASPIELLYLMDKASCIFTNSFHGTALSIILHKDFFVETNIGASNRITELLRNCGLEARGLQDGGFSRLFNEKDSDISWKKIDENIEEMLKEAKEYLKKITG